MFALASLSLCAVEVARLGLDPVAKGLLPSAAACWLPTAVEAKGAEAVLGSFGPGTGATAAGWAGSREAFPLPEPSAEDFDGPAFSCKHEQCHRAADSRSVEFAEASEPLGDRSVHLKSSLQ